MPSGSDPDPGDGRGPDGADHGAVTDLFIIGGGVNGVAIARDAAGRGLSVRLAEAGDLAQATSSASSKLIHGGLRYLEYLDLRLVRESLDERGTLLAMMPHIARPLRFVMPLDPTLRVASQTPSMRMLGRVMPWLKGRRPAWVLRAGLFLYDHLGKRHGLPGTRSINLTLGAEGEALDSRFRRAFEYSDVQVDDARLVVLTARDAAARGADIMTRAQVTNAEIHDGFWQVTLLDGRRFQARALVDAAGPWAGQVIHQLAHQRTASQIRLVRGSHIVTPSLYPHDKAYVLQGPDARIIFVIPFEDRFTLIGTTDVDHEGDPVEAHCSDAERDYLIAAVNRWLRRKISPEDVIWSFSGVRPLFDDGSDSASAVTRDYVLEMQDSSVPCLAVFGGKLTTHRRLAEEAMAKLVPALGKGSPDAWTAGAPLPGGDFAPDDSDALIDAIMEDFPWLDATAALRMFRAYGTDIWAMHQGISDPGHHFGAGLHEAELDWMVREEWARSAEDVLFRRSKLGLSLDAEARAAVAEWFGENR